jgi:hypothetical protein
MIQAGRRSIPERFVRQPVCQDTHFIHETTMRRFFFIIASFLLVACGHVAPSGDNGNGNGNISGSSITPYGVIDTGVTRTINR